MSATGGSGRAPVATVVRTVRGALVAAALAAAFGAPEALAHTPHTSGCAVPHGRSVSAIDVVRALDICEGLGGDVGTQSHAGTLTHEAFVTRDGARLWGNYPPAQNLIASLGLGTRVGWRYNYDSQYSVVLWYQTSIWGFMHRGSLTCCKNDGTPY